MTALFAMQSPYIVEWLMALPIILGLLITLVIVIIRWLFRINEQIELLTQIKDELRKLRLKKYPENREAEK